MATESKNKSLVILNLQQQHKEIAQYLRNRFRQFIKAQSQDFDSKGSQLPAFTENSKTNLINFFETVCDSFGRSYRALKDVKKLKDPSESSKNVKRLNLFLQQFCREHDIDVEHPVQLFTDHERPDRIYQVHLHFACARTGITGRNRIYSTDNITLKQAIENGKTKSSAVQMDGPIKSGSSLIVFESHLKEFREKLRNEAIEHVNEKLHGRDLSDLRDLELELGLISDNKNLHHTPEDHNREWKKFNLKEREITQGVYILSSEAGYGKTTFLRRLQLNLIEKTDLIPLFFDATELNNCDFKKRNSYSFLKGIANLLYGYLPAGCEQDFLQRHLDKIIFLIDGLDQIVGSGTEYKNLIDKLMGVIKNRLIIASRPFAVVDKEKEIDINFLRLAPFTEEDIKAYFSGNYERAKELCQRCSEMLYTPMLAYMIRLLIDEGRDANLKNRTGLYRAFTDYLFEDYPHENLQITESKKTKIKAAFEELSYNAIANDEVYLQKIPLDFAARSIPKDVDIDDLLKYGLAHIIINRTSGVSKFVYFSHQSIQEYFAAQWASKCEKRIDYVTCNLSEMYEKYEAPKWHNTGVFLAGIKGESIFKRIYGMWLNDKTNHPLLSYAFELCKEANKLEQYREVILKDIMHVLEDLKRNYILKGMQSSVMLDFFSLFIELDNSKATRYVLTLIKEYLSDDSSISNDFLATLMFNYIPFFVFTEKQTDELFEATMKIYRNESRPWEFDDIAFYDKFGERHIDKIVDYEYQNATELSESKIPPLLYFQNTAKKIHSKHLDKICDLMKNATDNRVKDRMLLLLLLYPYEGKLKQRHILNMIETVYSDDPRLQSQILEPFLCNLFGRIEQENSSEIIDEISNQENALIKEIGFRMVEIWQILAKKTIISDLEKTWKRKSHLSDLHELALKYILILTITAFSKKAGKDFSQEIRKHKKIAKQDIEELTVSYHTGVSPWPIYC